MARYRGRGSSRCPRAARHTSIGCTSKANASKRALCGLKGLIKGTIDTIEVDVKSTSIVQNRAPADWLASFAIRAQAKKKLNVVGENYSNVIACINRNDDNKCRPGWAEKRLGRRRKIRAKRRRRTADSALSSRRIAMSAAASPRRSPTCRPARSGKARLAQRLGGTIALDDLPLALDPLIGKGTIGGLVSATINLAGDRNAPSVEPGSTLNLTRAWFSRAYIGDMQLGVIPTTYGKVQAVRIYGSAMASQLRIDAIIGTAKPYPVDVVFSGRRVEVDHFVDLNKILGLSQTVQAWASGAVTLRTELSPFKGKQAQPEAWVELREVEAILNHRTRDGRRMPIHFSMVPREKNGTALSLRVTPSTLELSCRNFSVIGGGSPARPASSRRRASSRSRAARRSPRWRSARSANRST